MEVITIGGYIYPNNYQNPNNNAHLGRFLCLIATAKATSRGVENTPKRYPPTQA